MTTNIKHSIKELPQEAYIYQSPPPLVMNVIRKIIGSNDHLGADRMHQDLIHAMVRPGLYESISDAEMEALRSWWSTFKADWWMSSLRHEYYHGRPSVQQECLYHPSASIR
jgi:hypothetical protein